MANGTLKILPNSQKTYCKYAYTYGGTTYSDIHTLTTGGRTSQSIAPAISTSKVSLSELNPASVSANKVIAKTNACMYEYGINQFYGFFYQGAGYPMYFNQYAYDAVPDNHPMYTTHNYWPSFCVKKDGTSAIRWFESAQDLRTALPYCKCVIAAAHPLVFNGKCVLNERVTDNEPSKSLIYDPQNPNNENLRFKITAGAPMGKRKRTLLGHLKGVSGQYIMVCTDSAMTIKVAANMMQDMNCDYAVALDGGTPSQMRIKSGYGANGKVTANPGAPLHTAVCAHLV